MQSVRYFIVDVKSVPVTRFASDLYDSEKQGKVTASLEMVSPQCWGADGRTGLCVEPASVVLAKVSEKYELLDIAALSEVNFKPKEIVERFWRGWEHYGRPTLVTFNGRMTVLPVLELSAFRYGLSIPGWFSPVGKNYKPAHNRFSQSSHIDLQEIFTNFGTIRFDGALWLASSLIGKPGKMEVEPVKLAKMHEEGKTQEIENCGRYSVLNTYFVFLRTRVMMGFLPLSEEQKLVGATRSWLEEHLESCPAYKFYLEKWHELENMQEV